MQFVKHLFLYINLVWLLFINTNNNSFAQTQSFPDSSSHQKSFSGFNDGTGRNPLPEKPAVKNYWLPAAEIIGLNLGVWGYNKYLTKEGWS